MSSPNDPDGRQPMASGAATNAAAAPMTAHSSSAGSSSTQTSSSSSFYERVFTYELPPVHPGHVLLLCSTPLAYSAYRDYHQLLAKQAEQDMLQQAAGGGGGRGGSGRVLTMEELTKPNPASDRIRRAYAMSVASRAFGIATRGSLGAFGLLGAMTFYATGCRTLPEAMAATERWAGSSRQGVYRAFGIPYQDHRDHPDYIATHGMTEEEEYEYLAKTYFSETTLSVDQDESSADKS